MRPALVAFALLTAPLALAADKPATGGKDKAARAIAAVIDRHLSADWTARNIKPAPVADDEEFCRRVYLDIIGRIPKVSEVRAFAESTDADKRWKLVDQLLIKPG